MTAYALGLLIMVGALAFAARTILRERSGLS
jgi:cytochrome c biogenesis protein CcdA